MKIIKKKGFTLIELLVVVAIIGILTSVVLAALSSSRGKANDAKTQAQLKSMISQAQLYNGTLSTVAPSTTPITTGTAGGSLFDNNTSTSYSLYMLISKLPGGIIYYAWDGTSISTGGKWFVAASGSAGAFCVDYTSLVKAWKGTSPTTATDFDVAFPNLVSNPAYSCN